jgi:hypothetical protein
MSTLIAIFDHILIKFRFYTIFFIYYHDCAVEINSSLLKNDSGIIRLETESSPCTVTNMMDSMDGFIKDIIAFLWISVIFI